MRKPQGDLEWISKDGKMSWAHGEGEEAFQAGEKHEQSFSSWSTCSAQSDTNQRLQTAPNLTNSICKCFMWAVFISLFTITWQSKAGRFKMKMPTLHSFGKPGDLATLGSFSPPAGVSDRAQAASASSLVAFST